MEKPDVAKMLSDLEGLMENESSLRSKECTLANERNDLAKKIAEKRKEISKAVMRIDRDLAYCVGTEYGLVSKPKDA